MKQAALWIYHNIEKTITLLCFAIMCISLSAQLITRFMGEQLFFTEEISRYAYLWLVFIGLSLGEKDNLHYGVDLLVNTFPKKIRRFIVLLVDLCAVAMYAFLFYWGVRFVGFNAIMRSPALAMPMTVLNLCVPIGIGMATIRKMIFSFAQFLEVGERV